MRRKTAGHLVFLNNCRAAGHIVTLNEIIKRYINNESYNGISRNLNLPYKTISNIVELCIETGSIEAR